MSSQAFIDKGRVKIVDSNGHDYAEQVNVSARYFYFAQMLAVFTVVISLVLIGALLSKVFVDYFSVNQILFFLLLLGGSVFLNACSFDYRENKADLYVRWKAAHNLAKAELQDKILNLEKQLVHEQQIRNTKTAHKSVVL